MNWPLLLAGAGLFQVAGIAQVFHRRLPTRLFFGIEALAFYGGGILITLAFVSDRWFALVFAGIWTLIVLSALIALRGIVPKDESAQ